MIYKFSEIKAEMKGWWTDFVGSYRIIAECYNCPTCGKKLEYKGYANATDSKSFGICRDCDYARLFDATPGYVANVKRELSRPEPEAVAK